MKMILVLILELGAALSLYAQEEMTRKEWEAQQREEHVLDSIARIEWQELCKMDKEYHKALLKLNLRASPTYYKLRYWDSLKLNHRKHFFHTGYTTRAHSIDLRKKKAIERMQEEDREQAKRDRMLREEEERKAFKKKYKYGWRYKLYKARLYGR